MSLDAMSFIDCFAVLWSTQSPAFSALWVYGRSNSIRLRLHQLSSALALYKLMATYPLLWHHTDFVRCLFGPSMSLVS